MVSIGGTILLIIQTQTQSEEKKSPSSFTVVDISFTILDKKIYDVSLKQAINRHQGTSLTANSEEMRLPIYPSQRKWKLVLYYSFSLNFIRSKCISLYLSSSSWKDIHAIDCGKSIQIKVFRTSRSAKGTYNYGICYIYNIKFYTINIY